MVILVPPGRVFGNFGVEIDGHSRRGYFGCRWSGVSELTVFLAVFMPESCVIFVFFSLFWGDFVVFCFNWRRIIDFSWSRGAGSCL